MSTMTTATPHPPIPVTLGHRIFMARCLAGYRNDLGGFAALIGINRATLANYEAYGTPDFDGVRPPKSIVLDRIEAETGYSLAGDDDPRQGPDDGGNVVGIRANRGPDLPTDTSGCIYEFEKAA